jgi:hypothetical protein
VSTLVKKFQNKTFCTRVSHPILLKILNLDSLPTISTVLIPPPFSPSLSPLPSPLYFSLPYSLRIPLPFPLFLLRSEENKDRMEIREAGRERERK